MKEDEMMQETSGSNAIEYGSYLIIPLKFEGNISKIVNRCEKSGLIYNKIESADFNDIFKSMLNGQINNPVGICYTLPTNMLSGIADNSRTWICDGYEYKFTLSYLYVFHTKVAFLCIGVSYNDMESLNVLCNPGRTNRWKKEFVTQVKKDYTAKFELNESIQKLCADLNLQLFFEGSPALLDKYTYTIALTDKWFLTTDELQKKTFKLHQMVSLDSEVEDSSEDDIEYVYGVKDEERNSYRWGCCIASQIFTHIFAKNDTPEYCCIASTMEEESKNTLPIIVFSLYERYTCLRFTQALNLHLNNKAQLNELKKLMLAFKAYGTFPSVELSRYYNIKQIYRHLSNVNDIDKAIDDVEIKLKLLMEHQQESTQKKNDWLFYFITVFGAISIIEAAQSIVQNLKAGDPIVGGITVVSALLIFVVIAISRFRK